MKNSKKLFKVLLLISLLIPTIGNSQAIIGGTQIPIEDAPYQVSIESTSSWFLPLGHRCGGIILSDTWILSAAHCFYQNDNGQPQANLPTNALTIHAGSADQTDDSFGQRIGALPSITHGTEVIIHPDYNPNTNEHDLALIKLAQPLQFNHSVMPVEYANNINVIPADIDAPVNGSPGPIAFLTGWGGNCNNCQTPQALLKGVSMPLYDRTFAYNLNIAANVNNTYPITSDMLAFHSPGSSVGDGDSGGPAVINKNGNKIAIGVASWGAQPRNLLPSIYTNIRGHDYATWIYQTTGITPSSPGLDLYTKDKPWDMGEEPFSDSHPWTSEDIWVRRQPDGIEEHQEPEYYTQGNYNYVYVRVRNKGSVASAGNEELKLYWTNAATALSWPNHWNGTLSVNTTPVATPIGGEIGTVTLPVIQPGDAYIATFQWQPPNDPNDGFLGFASDPVFWLGKRHYYNLLSRIVSTSDPMTVPETNDVEANVLNNNNIAWKNISVVNLNPNDRPGLNDDLVGATALVGDAWGSANTYDIEFKNPNYIRGEPVTDNAEITITLDAPIWNKWQQGGFVAENFEVIDEAKKQIRLLTGSGKIKNLTFSAYERGLIHVAFNFLTDEVPQNNQYFFEVNQINSATNEVVGGELYEVAVPNRADFDAEAGTDQEIDAGNTITLSALQISEDAIYNWYNEAGELVHTGRDFTLTPDLTQEYKLEIISTLDGFKDYDEVEITVNKNKITALSPNPASSNLFINYDIEETITSAYFVLVEHTSSQSNQYIIDLTTDSKQIDVSNLPNGTYTLVLICDGQVTDYTNLIIQ